MGAEAECLCRVDVLVVCEPGTYQLGTGQGPLGNDPHCESSHCELLNQTTLATLEVVRCCILSLTLLDICSRACIEQSNPAQSSLGKAPPCHRKLCFSMKRKMLPVWGIFCRDSR